MYLYFVFTFIFNFLNISLERKLEKGSGINVKLGIFILAVSFIIYYFYQVPTQWVELTLQNQKLNNLVYFKICYFFYYFWKSKEFDVCMYTGCSLNIVFFPIFYK